MASSSGCSDEAHWRGPSALAPLRESSLQHSELRGAGWGPGAHWPLWHKTRQEEAHRAPAVAPSSSGETLLGLHSLGRARGPSSRSARRGPHSRGGKTRQSPRRAQRGHPRQAGASGRAGSGRAPRPSWSCCSGCACWWTAGSGSGSGCEDDRTEGQSGASAPSQGTGRPLL